MNVKLTAEQARILRILSGDGVLLQEVRVNAVEWRLREKVGASEEIIDYAVILRLAKAGLIRFLGREGNIDVVDISPAGRAALAAYEAKTETSAGRAYTYPELLDNFPDDPDAEQADATTPRTISLTAAARIGREVYDEMLARESAAREREAEGVIDVAEEGVGVIMTETEMLKERVERIERVLSDITAIISQHLKDGR